MFPGQHRSDSFRITQLLQRLLLQLADPVGAQTHAGGNVLDGGRLPGLQAVPQAQDEGFARRQGVDEDAYFPCEFVVFDDVERVEHVGVRDQVADGGFAVVTDRGVQAERDVGECAEFGDLGCGDPSGLCQFVDRWFFAEARAEVLFAAGEPGQFLHLSVGEPDRSGALCHAPPDALADPPHRIGGELVSLGVVEFLDRMNEAQVSLLHHVEVRHALPCVPFRLGGDQAQVGADQLVLGALPVFGDGLQGVPVAWPAARCFVVGEQVRGVHAGLDAFGQRDLLTCGQERDRGDLGEVLGDQIRTVVRFGRFDALGWWWVSSGVHEDPPVQFAAVSGSEDQRSALVREELCRWPLRLAPGGQTTVSGSPRARAAETRAAVASVP